jgi:hypothetical protein
MKNTFIGQYYVEDLSICDELISYHKNSETQIQGKCASEGMLIGVDKSIKDSTDVVLEESVVTQAYCTELQALLTKYLDEYMYANQVAKFGITDIINIQHYLPSQGYHKFHCERSSKVEPMASRHLAFMTYLNDVNDGGETEFFYQELKVKPKKGLTLIWPSDWTHTHRGITSNTEEKYIVTGWFNFIN